MTQRGPSNRIAAIMIVSIMLMPVGLPLIPAGSMLDEDVTTFDSGTFIKVVQDAGLNITLDTNQSMVDDWTLIETPQQPILRDFTMVSCGDHEEVFVTGGQKSGAYKDETIVFNMKDREWKKVALNSALTPGRINYSMAYSPVTDEVIVFGGEAPGILDETWVYSYTNDDWTNPALAPVPTARYGAAMVYVDTKESIFLFGGNDGNSALNDSWWYDPKAGVKWIDHADPDEPPPRYGHAMAYNSVRDETIMFGGDQTGNVQLKDTWIYNHTDKLWRKASTPGSSPVERSGHTMTFDPVRDRVLMYGGYNSANTEMLNDTWEFNLWTTTWTEIDTETEMPKGNGFGMAFDPSVDEVVMLTESDTWAFDHIGYEERGIYTSQEFDLQGNAYFGNFTWTADIPTDTAISFQFRSGGTYDEFTSSAFKGADGKNGTYYALNNDHLNSIHDGAQYLQYRIFLDSDNDTLTPSVSAFQLEYNLLHSLDLVTPTGGENITGIYQVEWQALDLDGDSLLYSMEFETSTHDIYGLDEDYNYTHYDWDTSELDNGSYRFCVIAEDDNLNIPLERTDCSDWFNVTHNGPPTVTLLSPEDGTTIHKTSVDLAWSGNDSDDDMITYTVLLDDVDGSTSVTVQAETVYTASSLTDGKTYYWTVTSTDGKDPGAIPEVRSFTVDLNRPPMFEDYTPIEATVGVPYYYMVNASDPDDDELTFSLVEYPTGMMLVSDIITWTPTAAQEGENNVSIKATDGMFEVFKNFTITVSSAAAANHAPNIKSDPVTTANVGETYTYQLVVEDQDLLDTHIYSLTQGPDGMTVDSTGKITWVPTMDQLGTVSVIVRVSDDYESATQSYSIIVKPSSTNHAPTITSEAPQNKKIEVGESFTYQVTATDPDAGDTMLFALTENPSGMVIDMNTGKITWTPGSDDIGTHNVQVTVADDGAGFDQQSFAVEVVEKTEPVNPPGPGGSGMGLYIILALIIIVVILAIAFIATRRKKSDQAPPPAEGTTDAGYEAPGGAATTAPAPAPVVVPPPVKEEVDPLPVIDDIFLIYSDGRLISHHTRKLRPDMDDQLLSGMFTAVQEFVKSSLGGKGKTVDEIKYGDQKVLIEHGKHLFMAAVIESESQGTKEMHENMKAAVHNIEFEFEDQLTEWDGDVNALEDAKNWIKMLISGDKIDRV